jgi:chemotaxis protein MotB
VGSYEYNLELSQDRALSIVHYILGSEKFDANELIEIRSKLTANGRSFSQLKRNVFGDADRDQSRRVEFKFRLKDEEMYKQFIEVDSSEI